MGKIHSDYKDGYIRFWDSATYETVDVIAPITFRDDFTDDTLATDQWVVAGVNSGTCAIEVAAQGHARITTGDADDDDVDVAGEIVWNPAKGCCCEAKIRNNDVSGLAWNFGFSDAKGEAADKIACTLSSSTLTSNAADCAMFVFDPDATTDNIYAASVDSDDESTIINTSTTSADAEWNVLRVEIDSTGNVDFWINGAHAGRADQSVGVSSADMCLYIGAINRETTGNTLDIDYVKAWQKR